MTKKQTTIYYSQNREDLILSSFLADIKKGFYVDVGAYDPVDDSVTKFFYIKGWKGINIEPQNFYYKRLKEDRKRDINLNIGISDKSGKLKLRTFAESKGISTFSDEVERSYEKDKIASKQQDVIVQVKTLKEVLSEHKVTGPIHFMKIDVEGFEAQVIRGNDWKKFRPEVLCIESDHVINDWRPILKENGYTIAYFDGINEYYLANEAIDRIELFKKEFPNLLVEGSIISYSWSKNIKGIEQTLERVQKTLDNYVTENTGLKEEIKVLKKENLQLLQELTSIKGAGIRITKNLLRKIKKV